MMLKYYIFHIIVVFASANPLIVWNVEEKIIPTFDKLISRATENVPVILFVFNGFNLAQFSKHASAYSDKADGGSLKNLKNVIDSSKGYFVKDDEINNEIMTSDFLTIYDSSKNIDLSKSRFIVVNVNSWSELDTLPKSIIERMGNNNYVAVLTDNLYPPKREKRETKLKEDRFENMTFINASDCLFLARKVKFHVRDFTDSNKVLSNSTYLAKFIDNSTEKSQSSCTNYTSTMNLNLSGGAKSWWRLESIEIDATGSLFEGGKFQGTYGRNRTEGYIESPLHFAYACGDQKIFFFPDGKDAKMKFGISFEDLQVQPFLKSKAKYNYFTDDVYDCVPFISIAIWMFLICASILLIIVFCGISMISSLKTMDRFDDPKGKTLVVNVKE